MTMILDGTGGVTFPAGGVGNPAGAVVGTTDTQTLTNKTLTTPVISSLSSASATSLTLQSAGTTAVTIDTSQFLLYNTTSTTVASASTANTGGINFRTSGAAGNGVIDIARTGDFPLNLNRLSTTGGIVNLIYNGASIGTISTNGTNAAYNTSSDYRLKENIAPMTGALAKVAQLKPVTYKWKSNGSDGEGFIAHELAEVMPHAVTGAKDAVDKEGNPEHQGIDVSFLVATLTAAIQEQQATITALTARIVALESA